MRYVAVSPMLSVILGGASFPRGLRGSMRDCDPILDSVGKEMGKVRSPRPAQQAAEIHPALQARQAY